MRNPFKSGATAQLDALIDDVMLRMANEDEVSDEYLKLTARLKSLTELRANTRPRISRDTLALCLTNLAGIIIIVGYEHAHVMTSKAMTQLRQPNVKQ